MIFKRDSSKKSANALKLVTVFGAAILLAGCSAIASRDSSGVVVSRRAQIRSSTAVVAADLLEVSRGDSLDILDSMEVPDPTDNSKKELWYRVRARDVDKTEGWIEARNIMPDDVLEKSRKLADEDKGTQAQATGQLHASSNLRLTPDRSTNENIMMRLDSGSTFEIVGWKRVPKIKESTPDESDVAPKPGSATTARSKADRSEEEDQEAQETTELWYKVRLSPANSPAPAGWIFGKQVELTVPSDIIYYRTGREFVAWRRLDEDTSDESSATKTKDVAKESRPGSWVILEKSSSKEPHKIGEPDFDRIYVLGYEKHDQDHYTAYRSPDIEGYLPMRVEGRGANRTFTVRIKDDSGQVKDTTFSLYRDEHGVMRVNPPEQMKAAKRK
ncbi:MAG TPA: hypothetical protein VGQ72_13905 [Pyrinomonadaceae bacterium]|jgi:hypothetical protein|nr:hypothetical protein [Pyrinomonadaceae bacterium]